MATINTATMTRDEYVAFRAVWKTEYKTLAADLRVAKIAIKNGMRAGAVTGERQNWLRQNQFVASDMLAQLEEAKAKLKTLSDEVARAA